jgi:hypothetical protein
MEKVQTTRLYYSYTYNNIIIFVVIIIVTNSILVYLRADSSG